MDGFVLLAAVEIDGELHQLVETEASVVGCSGCGTRALSKGRRRTKVRDLSCGGRPVVVVWAKRLWRCGDAACDVKTWSETLIAARASLTERAWAVQGHIRSSSSTRMRDAVRRGVRGTSRRGLAERCGEARGRGCFGGPGLRAEPCWTWFATCERAVWTSFPSRSGPASRRTVVSSCHSSTAQAFIPDGGPTRRSGRSGRCSERCMTRHQHSTPAPIRHGVSGSQARSRVDEPFTATATGSLEHPGSGW